MIEMVDGTGTTEWFYDQDGQANKLISPQGTILYVYRPTTGRLQDVIESVAGPDIAMHYVYDDAGRVETVSKFGETTTFQYDDASRPEKMTYDNGAYALYTYDGRSRIKAVEHKNSSHTLLRKETNVYDPASRITSRYEGPASGGVTTTFGYDDAGQLTSESSSGYSASYTYDANGNRTSRTVNGVTETYTVDDADKLTSITWSSGGNNYEKAYAYHFSGRVTGITYKTNGTPTSSETLTWNKENRLIGRGSDTYTYNGLNTRVAKSDGGGSFTYKRAGAHQTAPVLYDGAANFLPGISEKRSGTSTYLHSGIKNGQLQTNSSQTNTATNRYDAFGNLLATTGTWKGPFSYGGKFGYQSDEADMQLLGDRYYDPTIGRFLSRDVAQDGRNWYAYCWSFPTSAADPSGRILPILIVLAAGAVIGAAYGAYSEDDDRVGGAIKGATLGLIAAAVGVATAGAGTAGLGAVGITGVAGGAIAGAAGGAAGAAASGTVEYALGWRSTKLTLNEVLIGAAGGAIAGGFSLRPVANKGMVEVTHWGRDSPWVMVGGSSRRNWILSGAPKGEAVTAAVSGKSLKSPGGWEFGKGLLGQRILD